MSEVRAGIVVTGTEVLTGRIADRNGPWLSEQLAELGVEVAHILVVGDRPDDLEAALRFMASEGMDLIITSGGLGPTADDLTAEVVGKFAGRASGPRRGGGGEDRRDPARLRRAASDFDPEALREANRKQAIVPEGSIPLDPIGTAPGLVVPAGEQRRGRSARARRGSCSRCGRPRSRPLPVRGCARASDAAARLHAAHVRHPRVGDRQEPARDRGRRAWPCRRSRSPPACAAARSRSTCATATRPRRRPKRCGRACRAPPPPSLQPRRRDDRRAGRRRSCRGTASAWPSPAAAACWRRASPTCPAPRPTWPAASSPTRTRPRRSCSASTPS